MSYGTPVCPYCLTEAPSGRCDECGSPACDAHEVRLDTSKRFSGREIDERYRVSRLIGKGGMGSVYQAYDRIMGKKVAIKFLESAQEVTNPEAVVKRFLQEAQAIARLRSPNIVRFVDFGRFDNVPFLVMELLEGLPLTRYIARVGTLNAGEAAAIGVEICNALEAAHGMGLVHRDLKPDNVMVRRGDDGKLEVKVVDFGIAKLLGEEWAKAYRTRTGIVAGTPAYMAPEQVMAKTTVTPAADLYSLGMVLYQMLSGALPFEGDGLAILVHHVNTPPRPLPSTCGAPQALAALISQLLAKKPKQRPQSAAEVRAALSSMADMVGDTRGAAEALLPTETLDPYQCTSFDTRTLFPKGTLSPDRLDTDDDGSAPTAPAQRTPIEAAPRWRPPGHAAAEPATVVPPVTRSDTGLEPRQSGRPVDTATRAEQMPTRTPAPVRASSRPRWQPPGYPGTSSPASASSSESAKAFTPPPTSAPRMSFPTAGASTRPPRSSSRVGWKIVVAVAAAVGVVTLVIYLLARNGGLTGPSPVPISDVLDRCHELDDAYFYGVVMKSYDVPFSDYSVYKLADRTGSIWALSSHPAPPEGVDLEARGTPIPSQRLRDDCRNGGRVNHDCEAVAQAIHLLAGSCVLLEDARQ